jgi:hypothetical protein
MKTLESDLSQIPAPSISTCVTLGKWLNFSGSLFLHYKLGAIPINLIWEDFIKVYLVTSKKKNNSNKDSIKGGRSAL